MERMTKKMAITKEEIRETREEHSRVLDLFHRVRATEFKTDDGKSAKAQQMDKLRDRVNELWGKVETLEARLEVETVAMLGGEDTDMAEPTPAESLRQAS